MMLWLGRRRIMGGQGWGGEEEERGGAGLVAANVGALLWLPLHLEEMEEASLHGVRLQPGRRGTEVASVSAEAELPGDQFEAGGSRGVPREEQREGGGGKEGVTHDLDAFVELREAGWPHREAWRAQSGPEPARSRRCVCVSLSVQHGNEDEYEE